MPDICVPDFKQIWSFSTDLQESPLYQISHKSVYWEPRWYMPPYRERDMTKVIGAFRNYAKAPNVLPGVT